MTESGQKILPLMVEASGDNVIADPLLWLHVAAGVIALAAGIGAIVTTKGGRRHIQAGKLYSATMGIVVASAFPLAVWAENWFLFAIAIFTGYLIGSGYRVVLRRRAGVVDPTRADYALQGGMLVVGSGMVTGGGYGAIAGVMDLGEVLVVFGVIGGVLAARELYELRRSKAERTPWFRRHIVFMGGGYIATVTAAVTVNLTMFPEPVRWLGPTFVGSPLITYAVLKYRKRFVA